MKLIFISGMNILNIIMLPFFFTSPVSGKWINGCEPSQYDDNV